jgi:hypothetical protein
LLLGGVEFAGESFHLDLQHVEWHCSGVVCLKQFGSLSLHFE